MIIWGVDFFARRQDSELGRLREAMNEAREMKLDCEAARNAPWAAQECPYIAPESDPA